MGSTAAARGPAVAAGRGVRGCLFVGRGLAGLVAQVVGAAHAGDGHLVSRRLAVPAHAAEPDPAEIEEIVQLVRLEVYNRAQFCGAQAIRWRLADLAVHPLPPVRTIGRILVRHELTVRLRRVFLGDPFVPAANTS